MSRLDSAIRRLQAQRACLNTAADAIASVPGVVFELGLGNGRTYDHLRERCPAREIFVFERQVAAHPDCVPDAAHLYLGDVLETLPAAVERFAGGVALLHADIGTGDAVRNARLAEAIQPDLLRLLAPGAVAITDQQLPWTDADQIAPPDGVAPGRYFLYRRPGG